MLFGSAVHTESSHVFNLWLSQWRLSILGCDSAKPVLAFVLDSMLTESNQCIFWRHLEQFFGAEGNRAVPDSTAFNSPNFNFLSKEDVSAALERLEKPVLQHQLAMQAVQLPSQGAKCLLEHLSQSYSLEEESIVFWRIVESAIQPIEPQYIQPSVRII